MQILLYTVVQCCQHCLQCASRTYHHQAIDDIPESLTNGDISRIAQGFFHKFTTLNIHNSFALSLPAQNLPLSQILPTIGPHSLSRTDITDSGCSPFVSMSGFVLVPCVRLSWFTLAFDRTLISHSYLLTYSLTYFDTLTQQQQQQPFYSTTRVSQYRKTFTHSHLSWSSTIFYQLLELLQSIASSLFNIHARQSFCTTSLQVLIGLPLGLEPFTSYSIQFFVQSLSSFCNTCQHHCNLFCCSGKIMSSNPSLSLNSLLETLSITLTSYIHSTILILLIEMPPHFLSLSWWHIEIHCHISNCINHRSFYLFFAKFRGNVEIPRQSVNSVAQLEIL